MLRNSYVMSCCETCRFIVGFRHEVVEEVRSTRRMSFAVTDLTTLSTSGEVRWGPDLNR
jgi:hypothetical protein